MEGEDHGCDPRGTGRPQPLNDKVGEKASIRLFALVTMLTAMGRRHPRSGDCRLGHQAMSDHHWWTDLLTLGQRLFRSILPDEPGHFLEMDTSGYGWGAVLNRLRTARGFHHPERMGVNINRPELSAIRLALLSFRHLLRPGGAIIRPRCDSTVALGVLGAQSSPSMALMEEFRPHHALMADTTIQFRPEHAQSALNACTDRLSRETESTEWSLALPSFFRLDARQGPHSVDLFATELNTRCTRFYSEDLTPGALRAYSMRYSGASDNRWTNPPLNMMGAVIDMIIREGATVTLVAPVRKAQIWWSRPTEARNYCELLFEKERHPPARREVARQLDNFAILAECGTPLQGLLGDRNDADRWDRLFSL